MIIIFFGIVKVLNKSQLPPVHTHIDRLICPIKYLRQFGYIMTIPPPPRADGSEKCLFVIVNLSE